MKHGWVFAAIFCYSFLQASFCEDQRGIAALKAEVKDLKALVQYLVHENRQMTVRLNDLQSNDIEKRLSKLELKLSDDDLMLNNTIEERVTLLELRVGDLSGDLESVEDDINIISSEIITISSEQVTQDQKILELGLDIDGFEDAIESLIAANISVNQELESYDLTLTDHDNRLKRQEVSGTFAFQASLLANFVSPEQSPIVFDDVILNIGNGYNSQTGEFTVPTGGAGMYFLYVNFFAGNAEFVNLIVRVNGQEQCTAAGDLNDFQGEDNATPSCGAVVVLAEGDIVDVFYFDGTDETPTETTALRMNSFSGFRIAPGSL